MKRLLISTLITVLLLAICLGALELYLEHKGYGSPPLYAYDPATGYVLQPSQYLARHGGARVYINGFGMRCDDVTAAKPPGIFRLLVLGDSVPYGGSLIDQDRIFSHVAQESLRGRGYRAEVLNAAVNAWGPQNVAQYVRTRGLWDADVVIVFFPWGNLRRDFASYYVVPFWTTSPEWALAEFFRHGIWVMFGSLSKRWKQIDAFANEGALLQNLDALAAIKNACDHAGKPVLFCWSSGRDLVLGKTSNDYDNDIVKLRALIPADAFVDVTPVFLREQDRAGLYIDGVHFSVRGHQVVGSYLADLVRERFGSILSRARTADHGSP